MIATSLGAFFVFDADLAGTGDGHCGVFDEDVNRLIRFALHDENVVTSLLQLGTPVLAYLAHGYPSAERRLAPHAVASRGIDRSAGDGTEGEHQLVLRTQRVRTGRDLLEEAVGEPPPITPVGKKNPAAVALGKLGASKGGKARAAA